MAGPERLRRTRRSGGTALVLVLMLCLVGCGGPSSTVVGGLTVGATLDGLFDRVQETVDAAGAETSAQVTNAGSRVINVIDAARVAFEDSLDVAVDKVDTSVAGRLDQIESITNEFTENAFEKATSIQAQAQQLLLTLPFANGSPQVRGWTPHFVTGQESVTVVVDGIFTQTQREGMQPELRVGTAQVGDASSSDGTAADVGANTTQKLVFIVPADQFGSAPVSDVTPVQATLTVPYRSSVLRRDETATYTLLFGRLPSSPGTLRVQRISHTQVHEVRAMRSGDFKQGGLDRPETQLYCTNDLPEGGWRIVPSAPGEHLMRVDWDSGSVNADRREGVAWTRLYESADSASKKCVSVWTREFSRGFMGIGWYHSGDVSFHLEWSIERWVDVATWVEEPTVQLEWGAAYDFPYPTGEWKLTYQPFQGPPLEIGGPHQTTWLTVSTGLDSVAVTTVTPDNVVF